MESADNTNSKYITFDNALKKAKDIYQMIGVVLIHLDEYGKHYTVIKKILKRMQRDSNTDLYNLRFRTSRRFINHLGRLCTIVCLINAKEYNHYVLVSLRDMLIQIIGRECVKLEWPKYDFDDKCYNIH